MRAAPALDRLFCLMSERVHLRAIVEGDMEYSYSDLLTDISLAEAELEGREVCPGMVIGLRADFSVASIAMALALFRRGAIVAFLSTGHKDPSFLLGAAHAAGIFSYGGEGQAAYEALPAPPPHPLLEQLNAAKRSGFIVFSTGTSGKPKAVLHDLETFLGNYDRRVKAFTTLAFLLFDHIAGLDTLFYTLHAGGSLVLTADRKPAAILGLVERWSVEVLPVSPSFLKLLCLSGATGQADLSSLKIITFGSEPMDPGTLQRIGTLLPHVRLNQKYGASEFGAPSARTRSDNGLWIKLESDQVKVRVEDNVLWLKVPSTTLGYLNAEAPLMRDGWICTGDLVEVEGDWLRILGRQTDMINVGGEKVLPSEVEAVIQELDEVAEVAVSGEPHPILGQIVTASIRVASPDVDISTLRAAVRKHCLTRLDRFKVPVKISSTDRSLTNDRQKTLR